VPAMTEIQAEALDMVHFTAAKHALTMRLQRGDIQLLNNLAVMHARSAFVDGSERIDGGVPATENSGATDDAAAAVEWQVRRRHMIRLWLRNEEMAWETPEALRSVWEQKYGPLSERVRNAKWAVVPELSRRRVIRKVDSCS